MNALEVYSLVYFLIGIGMVAAATLIIDDAPLAIAGYLVAFAAIIVSIAISLKKLREEGEEITVSKTAQLKQSSCIQNVPKHLTESHERRTIGNRR